MKKIIKNLVYDTDTAREIGSYLINPGDLTELSETLYRKRNGEYFLHGQGGAKTRYAEPRGDNRWGSGEMIIPLSWDKAREWAEEHLAADDYLRIFAIPDESPQARETLCIDIPASLMAQLRQTASQSRRTLTDTICQLLADGLGAL